MMYSTTKIVWLRNVKATGPLQNAWRCSECERASMPKVSIAHCRFYRSVVLTEECCHGWWKRNSRWLRGESEDGRRDSTGVAICYRLWDARADSFIFFVSSNVIINQCVYETPSSKVSRKPPNKQNIHCQ